MCRVNPKKIRQPEIFRACWILNPNPEEIRPYRILIKIIHLSPIKNYNYFYYTQYPIVYIFLML